MLTSGNIKTQTPGPLKSKPRARRPGSLTFCDCGRRLTCWLCIGKGHMPTAKLRWVDEKDACYGCSGLGVTPCRGCTAEVIS